MFHESLRRTWVLLSLDEIVNRCQSYLVHWWYGQVQLRPYWFLLAGSVRVLKSPTRIVDSSISPGTSVSFCWINSFNLVAALWSRFSHYSDFQLGKPRHRAKQSSPVVTLVGRWPRWDLNPGPRPRLPCMSHHMLCFHPVPGTELSGFWTFSLSSDHSPVGMAAVLSPTFQVGKRRHRTTQRPAPGHTARQRQLGLEPKCLWPPPQVLLNAPHFPPKTTQRPPILLKKHSDP